MYKEVNSECKMNVTYNYVKRKPMEVSKKLSNEKIKLNYLNSRSLKIVNFNINKLVLVVDFQNLVYLSTCDVVSVTESWLNESVLNSEILYINKYVIYRRGRGEKQRGGVAEAYWWLSKKRLLLFIFQYLRHVKFY